MNISKNIESYNTQIKRLLRNRDISELSVFEAKILTSLTLGLVKNKFLNIKEKHCLK